MLAVGHPQARGCRKQALEVVGGTESGSGLGDYALPPLTVPITVTVRKGTFLCACMLVDDLMRARHPAQP